MKKALKISTYYLVLSGIIALALCYLIIPERTKCAIDIVVEYLNKPLGIAFGSTITLGLVLYLILKMLWERYKNSIKKDTENYKSELRKKEQELEQREKTINVKESEIKTILGTYSTHIDKLTDLVVKVCETSPNAKIKAIAKEVKGVEVELSQELEQKKNIVEKYSDDDIKTILDKVNELEKVVNTYEQREETTND